MNEVTNEMILYGITAFGGSIIYVGNNHEMRAKTWQLISVLLTGLLVGMTLTIPLYDMVAEHWPILQTNKSGRMGFALMLGFIAPYAFRILNTGLKKIEQNPSVLFKGLVELVRKNLPKNEYVLLNH